MNREPLNSSNIKATGYNVTTREMEIEFSLGSVYVYRGVDRTLYDALRASESPGKFFRERVKDVYPCEKR
jgi:hypothetical protein